MGLVCKIITNVFSQSLTQLLSADHRCVVTAYVVMFYQSANSVYYLPTSCQQVSITHALFNETTADQSLHGS